MARRRSSTSHLPWHLKAVLKERQALAEAALAIPPDQPRVLWGPSTYTDADGATFHVPIDQKAQARVIRRLQAERQRRLDALQQHTQRLENQRLRAEQCRRAAKDAAHARSKEAQVQADHLADSINNWIAEKPGRTHLRSALGLAKALPHDLWRMLRKHDPKDPTKALAARIRSLRKAGKINF